MAKSKSDSDSDPDSGYDMTFMLNKLYSYAFVDCKPVILLLLRLYF